MIIMIILIIVSITIIIIIGASPYGAGRDERPPGHRWA